VLARAGARAPELFLVQRPSGRTFGASYVFPGGVLEPDDGDAARFSALAPEAANRCLGLAGGGLDFYCAAIRELFEETGVLLARSDGKLPPPERLAAARARLNDGTLRWSDFLADNGLVLATDAMHYFAWWITPRARPKRFSTRFFLAALPEGQEASHDGRELTASRWMTASDAIEAARAGELALPPPTLATLHDLAACAGLEELLAWAARRAREGVPRILPAIVRRDGHDRVLMPGDPEYPPDADAGET
jgi:8-oxo-dGTP pyrophosphatase MutT (NUDIX family)